MNKVSDIISRKNSLPVSVDPGTSVLEALKIMAEKNIGSVLVTKEGKYLGLVTERDYSRKVVLMGKHSNDTKVSEIMTADLPYISPSQSIDECMELMTSKNIRYLPVFENDQLINIISMTDVVIETIIRQQQTISHLDNYIRS